MSRCFRTPGHGDIFGPEFDKNRLELKTLQDYVKLYGIRGPEFEPGSRWKYSNYGFLLLGVIVEKVSGQNYYDYVRDHIFTPAGMIATGSEPEVQVVADRSVGYRRSDGTGWQRNTGYVVAVLANLDPAAASRVADFITNRLPIK